MVPSLTRQTTVLSHVCFSLSRFTGNSEFSSADEKREEWVKSAVPLVTRMSKQMKIHHQTNELSSPSFNSH